MKFIAAIISLTVLLGFCIMCLKLVIDSVKFLIWLKNYKGEEASVINRIFPMDKQHIVRISLGSLGILVAPFLVLTTIDVVRDKRLSLDSISVFAISSGIGAIAVLAGSYMQTRQILKLRKQFLKVVSNNLVTAVPVSISVRAERFRFLKTIVLKDRKLGLVFGRTGVESGEGYIFRFRKNYLFHQYPVNAFVTEAELKELKECCRAKAS